MAIKKTASEYLEAFVNENKLSNFFNDLSYDSTQTPEYLKIIPVQSVDFTPINFNLNKDIYVPSYLGSEINQIFYNSDKYIRYRSGIEMDSSYSDKIVNLGEINTFNALSIENDSKLRYEKVIENKNVSLKYIYFKDYIFDYLYHISSYEAVAQDMENVFSYSNPNRNAGPLYYYINVDKEGNLNILDKTIYSISNENEKRPINSFDHVLVRVKRFKDVFSKDMIDGLIYNLNNETIGTYDEAIKKYGDYLVPVASDGIYYPQSKKCSSLNLEYSDTRDYVINMFKNFSIIFPVTSNDTPIISTEAITNVLNPTGIPFSVKFSDSLVTIFKTNVTNFGYDLYNPDFNKIPYEYDVQKYTLLALITTIGFFNTDFSVPKELVDSGTINYIEDLDDKKYTFNRKKVIYEEFHGENIVEWHPNNCLYTEEKNPTIGSRCLCFRCNPKREFEIQHQDGSYGYFLPIFNQEDFENYLKAFNIKFKYEFDLSPITPSFGEFEKIRRESLSNTKGNLEVSKIRRPSLANVQDNLEVTKIRRDSVLWP